MCELAGESDVLILGENHGTQEVPAVAAALLAPLSELGYGALALEIPADDQGPLTDWATGKTEALPNFFTQPYADGRGNIQVLSLIRAALSPPYGWKLICFDQSWEGNEKDDAESRKTERQVASQLSMEDPIAVCVRRDATMALNLADQRTRLAPDAKVLAICGNFHARTSRHSANDKQLGLPADSPLHKLWPSFAAGLQTGHSAWQVRSVNIVPRGGAYFATVSIDGGPPKAGIHTIRAARELDQAESHPLADDHWNWELNLPNATPVTFLAEPAILPPASPAPESVSQPHAPTRRHLPCSPHRRLGHRFFRIPALRCRR